MSPYIYQMQFLLFCIPHWP